MKKSTWIIYSTLLLFLLTVISVNASPIDPGLASALRNLNPEDDVSVIIILNDQVNLKKVTGSKTKRGKAKFIKSLRNKAEEQQKSLRDFFKAKRAKRVLPFWIFNGMAATIKAADVQELTSQSGIKSIKLDGILFEPKGANTKIGVPEWNLDAVGAPLLWELGFTGTGVVVAGMDTGVDLDHPDLGEKFRGGTNSWYDPHGEHETPYDYSGHGTQTMGIMVGGSNGGTAIGVAPTAQWIAVKMFDDDGLAPYSAVHQSFQWLLDPDGNPETDDLPDLINSSWGYRELVGECFTEFQQDIETLKAAGVAVVFSGGNEGPFDSTSVSPANNSGSFAVGAVDDQEVVLNSSSRGPSACDGSIYPEIVAPGLYITTTDITLGGLFPDAYTSVSGASFAAPHLAGGMALLLDAFPEATVTQLEQALLSSGQDLGEIGPDNSYGNGLVDLMEAYNQLSDILSSNPTPNGGQSPVASADTYCDIQDVAITVSAPGVLGNDTDSENDALTVDLTSLTEPSNGTLQLNSDGSFTYTPTTGFTGTDSFSYQTSDGTSNSNTAKVTINVNAAQVTCTDESNFLSLLKNLGYQSVTESFESDAAWGTVRTTISATNTASSITSSALTWTANTDNSNITTGEGPARTGLWGFYSLPHGNLNQVDENAPLRDGFIGTSTDTLIGVGGWVRSNTDSAKIAMLLDGITNITFDDPAISSTHKFVGVIDTAGFSKFEFYETEGTLGDQEIFFIDDVSYATSSSTPSTRSPIYRFWSEQNLSHFFTISAEEKDSIIASYTEDVWLYEGINYYAYASGDQTTTSKPIYRFWSAQNGSHFFTISAEEKDFIIANYATEVWNYEGIAYYAYATNEQPTDAMPVYRFWSAQNGSHFFTISEGEKDFIIANYTTDVWQYEGIAWYAYDVQ